MTSLIDKDYQVIRLDWVMITRKLIKAQYLEYLKVIKIQILMQLPFRVVIGQIDKCGHKLISLVSPRN
jgi:hypothetical protein